MHLNNLYEANGKSSAETFLTISLITDDKIFKQLQRDWSELNNKADKGNIFTSWEWLYTWWEVYKADGKRQLYIICCYDPSEKLVGIAPLQIAYNPKKYFPCSRQVIMLGTGETDGSAVFGEYMDLIIAPGNEQAVIKTVSDFLFTNKELWDGLKFHQLLNNSHISDLFSEYQADIIKTTQRHGFRTLIELPDSYKAYLMSLKKKMRNNITRTFSRLQREKKFSIESVDNSKHIDKAISLLADLNRARRGYLEKPSSFEQPNFENYHHKLAKRLLNQSNPQQGISLKILRFEQEPVAVLYSFIDGDTIHAYQSGFEKENGQRYSLLTMMLTQEISSSIENNRLKYFNFMYSDDESTYKRRYAGNTESMYNISFEKKNIKSHLFLFIHGPVKQQLKRLIRGLSRKQG